MNDVSVAPELVKAAKSYARDAGALIIAGSTTEATYYPAIKALMTAALTVEDLPFDVRVNTSEEKLGGSKNLPDIAFYDTGGLFLTVCGEVKLPDMELEELAMSTDGNDQIGRYLAVTRAVLLSNVRAFGLLTVKPDWDGSGPVPPESRRIEQVVDLWPSAAALKQKEPIDAASLSAFAKLVEIAVTRYAPIAEPESLARIMAWQAKRAKADLPTKFTHAVQGLLDDFVKALGVTFEGPEGEEFLRSSLIQTAYYGLFAGWALWWQGERKRPFRWEDLADYLKIPFLGSLFYEFRHPSRIKELRLARHLDIGTETLARVDPKRFFKRFRPPKLDENTQAATTAIMYFYEPFLEAFDPKLRKELGVWYTPTHVIRYQVAKIDRLLRDELGCSRGFADERVVVLDPACGTGAYLIEVLRHMARQLDDEGAKATLAAQLLDAMCRRFIGFEILTAPFVVAHLQLYLLLSEVGAEPDESHRPAIFLTNALTGWQGPDQRRLNFPELQEEHDAARDVKRDAKVIVVLGNPPYNRFAGIPLEEEAALVDHYKGIKRKKDGKQIGQSALFVRWGVRKQLLDELYVRFLRLAEVRIGEKSEFGVVSYISNSSFLTGRSHPIVRESLLHSFHAIWIDNLNGDKYETGKVVPAGLPGEGTADQSIFTTEHDPRGIQVGTCITTYLKRKPIPQKPGAIATVSYRNFWGSAEGKREALVASLTLESWSRAKRATAACTPAGPRDYEQFVPTAATRWRLIPASFDGVEEWPRLDDLFPVSFQGLNPNRGREGSVIDMDHTVLEERMRDYFSKSSFDELKKRHPILCTERARYNPQMVREKILAKGGFNRCKVLPYVVFPFDVRWIYYEREGKFLNESRPDLGNHLKDNEFLVGAPKARRVSESRSLVLSQLFDLHLHDWGSVGFPAELNPDEGIGGLLNPDPADLKRSANLTESVWAALKEAYGKEGDLTGQDAKHLCRALFRYSLAIIHAPHYEANHKDSLAQDWPHIPICKDAAGFKEIVALGERITQLLDPQGDAGPVLKDLLSKDVKTLAVVRRIGGGTVKETDLVVDHSYFGSAAGKWEQRAPEDTELQDPEWGERTGDLYLNNTVFLSHVPQAVWRYEMGGYPVLKKWLGYRDARRRDGAPLTLAELAHLRNMIHRLSALLTLRPTLNNAYEMASADAWLTDELTGKPSAK